MDTHLRTLFIDAQTGFYKIRRYKIGDFFGPVDLGLHLTKKYDSFNFGTGLLAGSIFPGSNRLVFTGHSPCWNGFYISSMGGAGLVFDNLGINMVSIVNKSAQPAILYLNRDHGEEIQIELFPVNIQDIWQQGRQGMYAMFDYAFERFQDHYENEPRILAVGPAAAVTDFAGIGSVPIKRGQLTFVDTWAGRGGFGSLMLQKHGLAGIIYGGTFIDEDFRDRKVADSWFQEKYQKKLTAKDIEATTKYRFDPNFDTGGTFGVNYASIGGRLMAFNYRTIYWTEQERLRLHEQFVLKHYLKQFNEETIQKKQQSNCGEPCPAVCKKMNNEFKKDYEPYQTMGPLCGIFDQRAAEKINHYADAMGFDAISLGGVLSWLMDCLDGGLLEPEELGVNSKPRFINQPNTDMEQFNIIDDSMHNADLGIELIKSILQKKGRLDLSQGARKLARHLARDKGKEVMDRFVFNSFGRNGWIVPNQYWTPGALSPMSIMGKYYMNYGSDFIPPQKLGQINAERMVQELILDNLGVCRFHRKWAEEMLPEIIEQLYGKKEEFLRSVRQTASRIQSRNDSTYWESQRDVDYVRTFILRRLEMSQKNGTAPATDLEHWAQKFNQNQNQAGIEYWYEIHKGSQMSLREFS